MPSAYTYSPAINAGDNTQCPADDQRGVARPVGANCDIGAVETSFLKASQAITFNPLADQNINAPPFGISATASSGLTVSFSSLTVSACTVSGSTVTLVAVGACTLRASQAGNASYLAAPNVDRSFTVLLTQTINFGPLANQGIVAAPFNLNASATSGLAVSFGSLTPAVCSVSGSAVTLETAGTCTLRASQAGNATYAAAPNVDQSFLVFGHVLFLPLTMRNS